MGRIAGIQIKNYGSLKNIKLGKLLGDNSGRELTNMNAIIGQSGTGCVWLFSRLYGKRC